MNTRHPPPKLRHDYDRAVWRSVMELNEYRLPDDMRGMCVLDVGGNAGFFARAVAERNGFVTSYEPDRANVALYDENTRHVGWLVHCVNKAVMDAPGEMTLYRGADPAGYTLFPSGCPGGVAGERVPVEGFAQAVWEATFVSNRPRVDLCKIDAEGAEYPIIENCDFANVAELLVEFHRNYVPDAEARAEACRERLKVLGFKELRWEATHEETGEWYRLYHGRKEG